MGLKETIQNAAKTALTAVGDLAGEVTYRSIAPGVYNSTTGKKAVVNTDQTLNAVKMEFSERELESSSVKTGDVKFLFARSLVTIDPKIGDQILEGGHKWKVVKPTTDPAEATWVLHCRI